MVHLVGDKVSIHPLGRGRVKDASHMYLPHIQNISRYGYSNEFCRCSTDFHTPNFYKIPLGDKIMTCKIIFCFVKYFFDV